MQALAIVVLWVHLLAAVTWLGGLIFMNVVLSPAVGAKGVPPQFVRLMGMQRFKGYAWASIVVVVVTGTMNTLGNVNRFDAFYTTPYGITLAIKILLVLLMIGITAWNSLRLGPKLAQGAPAPGAQPGTDVVALQKRLVILSYVNVTLGVIVLLLAAILRVAPNY